jgi:predicted amidohydrolase YtcJ
VSEIVVFTAAMIRTMNDSTPTATAVATRDGQIIEVGSLESMQPWLDAHPHRIDEQFADKVLMPGLIDPHLHPSMAAILLPMHFITAVKWELPWQTVHPVHGHDAFMARLREIDQEIDNPAEPMFSWGYQSIWHGEMNRELIDSVSMERPIIVWQRSFHELYVNSAALNWMGLTEEALADHPQVQAEAGRFFETGLSVALAAFRGYLLDEERFSDGLDRLRQVVQHGGQTTIGDLAVGMFGSIEDERQKLIDVLDHPETPFRIHMTARGAQRGEGAEAVDENLERIGALPEANTDRVFFTDHVKLFTDGGFFAELMQLQEPGFIDGHHGEWLMVPEQFEAAARAYWYAGFKIHVHCTGDLGLELALDVLDKLQFERPRFDHRYTIEHMGVSTPEQCKRIARLGAQVSANVYYLYELSDAYWQHSIGYERASTMGRLGSLVNEGVPVALHSDFTMAPAQPLNSAWVAVNRISSEGNVMAPAERLTVHQAMRAITIDAAYMIGLENDVGSIRAGKRADFAVLDADPYEVPPEALRDISIWGTVFEGQPFPIDRSA